MKSEIEENTLAVLGQKYAYATVSLVLGISCFVSLLGLEKALLAIAFGWLALRDRPLPRLTEHRGWAKAGIVLGIIPLIVLPLIIVLNADRVREIIEALSRLNGTR
jgi:Domain of unknown function (DUF4190)